MVREGEKGELVNPVHTMNNPPMIKAKPSTICLRSHRSYDSSCGLRVRMNLNDGVKFKFSALMARKHTHPGPLSYSSTCPRGTPALPA